MIKRQKILFPALVLMGLGTFIALSNTMLDPDVNLFMNSYFSYLRIYMLLLGVQAAIGLIYLSYRFLGDRGRTIF